MIKDLLLPREKYSEEAQKYSPVPFTFEIKKEGQVLYYFGANHSHDPNNHQYPLLRRYWKEFVEKTNGRDKVALVEGGLRKLAQSEAQAIKDGGEGSWVTYFAKQDSIPVFCPDLSDEEFEKYELSDVEKEGWLLINFLRTVQWYQRRNEHVPLARVSESIRKSNYGLKTDITPESLLALYKKHIGRDFDPHEDLNELMNPNRDKYITNRVERINSDLREVKVVSEIENQWKEGKSIFVAFGCGHLIVQRPALEKLLK